MNEYSDVTCTIRRAIIFMGIPYQSNHNYCKLAVYLKGHGSCYNFSEIVYLRTFWMGFLFSKVATSGSLNC